MRLENLAHEEYASVKEPTSYNSINSRIPENGIINRMALNISSPNEGSSSGSGTDSGRCMACSAGPLRIPD